MSQRVLSIGQCMADHSYLSYTVKRYFPVEVLPCPCAEQALKRLQEESFVLVLVNRVFDGDGDSGVDFIRRIKSDPALATVPIMLVSNYADAQEEAVRHGALPGFGKEGLGKPSMVATLAKVLGPAHNS